MKLAGVEVVEVETPCLVIDSEKMMKNITRMAHVASEAGVHLRPHVKTHKVPRIAQMQLASGAVGITVAKVSEAEVMYSGGVQNIFIAYPLVVESKITRAVNLSKKMDLIVAVDSLVGAKKLSEIATRHNHTLNVRLEVDTGLHRTGVNYDEAVELAKAVSRLGGLNLTGIYTYRGALLGESPTLDTKAAALEEGKMMADLARRMRSEGLAITEVSVGSTPTGPYVAEIEGITEIRPGTYVFGDRMQVGLKSLTMEDCAAYIVATVVSRPSEDLIIVDGGSKTFATDVQPGVAPLHLKGFGQVLSCDEAVFERMTEEHGMIRIPKDCDISIGDQLQIIPNHICSTVNLHNFAFLKTDGAYEQIEIAARGRLD